MLNYKINKKYNYIGRPKFDPIWDMDPTNFFFLNCRVYYTRHYLLYNLPEFISQLLGIMLMCQYQHIDNELICEVKNFN
jgi:hypothetical protein